MLPGARHRRLSPSRSAVPSTEEAVGGDDRLSSADQAVVTVLGRACRSRLVSRRPPTHPARPPARRCTRQSTDSGAASMPADGSAIAHPAWLGASIGGATDAVQITESGAPTRCSTDARSTPVTRAHSTRAPRLLRGRERPICALSAQSELDGLARTASTPALSATAERDGYRVGGAAESSPLRHATLRRPPTIDRVQAAFASPRDPRRGKRCWITAVWPPARP